MRKLLIFLTFFVLTISVNAQLVKTSVVYAQPAAGPLYGDEIVTNGTFDANITGWFNGGGNWAWNAGSGGVALHTSGAAGSLAELDAGLVVGTTYHFVFTVGGRTAGTIQARAGDKSGGFDTAKSSDGTYTVDLTVAETGNGVIYFYADSDFDGWLDNISVKEVL